MSRTSQRITRRYVVNGRVQGVGFRAFVQHRATAIGLSGWVRNCDDGSVEALATGLPEQLTEFEGALHQGPRWSDVRNVTVREDAPSGGAGFSVRY